MWRTSILSLTLLVGSAAAAMGQPVVRTPVQPNNSGPLPALPEGAIIRLGSSRFNHGGQITACAFSPDSHSLVTGGNDGMIRMWDVASGVERRSWRMNTNYNNITALRYSPDGKMLAASSAEGSIRIWDAEGNNEVFVREMRIYDPSPFCWVGKASQIAVASRNGSVKLIEVPSGRELKTWSSGINNPIMLAGSPTGKQLVIASYNTDLKTYDVAAGKPGVTFENPQPGMNMYRPNHAATYTPDGKFLIGSGSNQAFYMWSAETGKIARRLDMTPNGVYSMAVSPNGRFLATNSYDGRIRIVGLASGAELRVFHSVRNGSSNLMAYSPNGRYLATVLNGQSIRIWDIAGGKELHDDAGHRGPIIAAAFLGDGRVVTAGQDQTVRCWDPKTGKELDRLEQQYIYAAHLVPDADGHSMLFASNQMFVLKWTPGKNSLTERYALSSQGGVTALASDGKAAVVQMNQTLNVCAVPDGKEIRQISMQPNSYPQTVCISPGARYLAYVDNNMYGMVHIWDVSNGHQRRTIAGDQTMSLYAERMMFSPDGRLLVSVASHRPVLVWEVFTGLVRLALPATTIPGQSTAAFSHNGRLLAVGSSTGETRIIDMRSGAVAGPFVGHRGQVTGLAFSADGKQMISCSADTTAVVWDVDKLLANLPRTQISPATARQMDGWWMGLASGDGRAASEAIWSLTDRPRETLALFREKLKPIVGPDAAAVARWVSELDSPKFHVREKASTNLAAMGESAREQLEAGLKNAGSAEARFRLTRLLNVINSQVSPAKLQPLRALEVLEKIGGSEAKEQLETLAKQSTDAEIRKEIDRVLERWK